MAERVLIAGSRNYPPSLYPVIRTFVAGFPPDTTIIHGACPDSPDVIAAQAATDLGMPVDSYPVTPEEWRTHGKAAGPMRNQRMLFEGKPTQVVVFWDLHSRGAMHMITIARQAGKPLTVYGPDGEEVG